MLKALCPSRPEVGYAGAKNDTGLEKGREEKRSQHFCDQSGAKGRLHLPRPRTRVLADERDEKLRSVLSRRSQNLGRLVAHLCDKLDTDCTPLTLLDRQTSSRYSDDRISKLGKFQDVDDFLYVSRDLGLGSSLWESQSGREEERLTDGLGRFMNVHLRDVTLIGWINRGT